MDFNKLNKELYLRGGHYKFAKKPTDFDKGYMKINDWVNDLCFYYIKRQEAFEKEIEIEFKMHVQEQKEKVLSLEPSLYKDGLLKAIDDVE